MDATLRGAPGSRNRRRAGALLSAGSGPLSVPGYGGMDERLVELDTSCTGGKNHSPNIGREK